jgi:hypothetical protein
MQGAVPDKRRIRRYRPDLEQGIVSRTNDERGLDGIGGRIPDRDPKLSPVLRIPQARCSFRRLPMSFADRRCAHRRRCPNPEQADGEQAETKDGPGIHRTDIPEQRAYQRR